MRTATVRTSRNATLPTSLFGGLAESPHYLLRGFRARQVDHHARDGGIEFFHTLGEGRFRNLGAEGFDLFEHGVQVSLVQQCDALGVVGNLNQVRGIKRLADEFGNPALHAREPVGNGIVS